MTRTTDLYDYDPEQGDASQSSQLRYKFPATVCLALYHEYCLTIFSPSSSMLSKKNPDCLEEYTTDRLDVHLNTSVSRPQNI